MKFDLFVKGLTYSQLELLEQEVKAELRERDTLRYGPIDESIGIKGIG